MNRNSNTAIIVALAWPETYCKQPGSWYDSLMRLLDINSWYYYKAGHAALIIVNIEEEKCYYFDFGRYHAPLHHGRVRDEISDPELGIMIKAEFDKEKSTITNLDKILLEMQKNPSYHGDGPLYASQISGNFLKAFSRAKYMQDRIFIPYGPFIWGGTNCSRFVSRVIRKGGIPFINWFKMLFLVPFTPTPMSNVKSLRARIKIEKPFEEVKFQPAAITKHLAGSKLREFLITTKAAPVKSASIPPNSHWLSGEGAGSWFYIESISSTFLVVRYSPDGLVECKGQFGLLKEIGFNPEEPYNIQYPSDCSRITAIQNGHKFIFHRVIQ